MSRLNKALDNYKTILDLPFRVFIKASVLAGMLSLRLNNGLTFTILSILMYDI